MRHEQRRVKASDGLDLHVDVWRPQEPPRFVVVFAHGAGEHVRRYEHVARRFVDQGGLAFGPDHRGQGLSGGRRGHVETFDQYGEDLTTVMNAIGREWSPPGADRPPWFLFGHSMGGLIALDWLQQRAADVPIRGAVISAPLLALAMEVPPLKLWLGQLAGRLVPNLSLPSGIPADAISRDPEEVARYVADRERADVVTAAWFRAMNEARESVGAKIAAMTTPMLWVVGTGDRVCDHQAMRTAFGTLRDPAAHDQTLAVFEGYYHEAHNEPEAWRRPVIERETEWIVTRAQSGREGA